MFSKISGRLGLSIRQRIYWSFFLLVFLFVISGIITIHTLNLNKKLSGHLSYVVEPSLQYLNDFKEIMVESKMYTTNWVFLRAKEEDKQALLNIHHSRYYELRKRINTYSNRWIDKSNVDSMTKIYAGFEELLAVEKGIMSSLKQFSDYDDPVTKLEAEHKVEDEVLPRTVALMSSLDEIIAFEEIIRKQENNTLELYSVKLRFFTLALIICILCIGFFLSIYMTRIIIEPVNKIRDIVNDLGKGIIKKINSPGGKDEIGEMINSVNNLSEKLQTTATFAHEIGMRNFTMPFRPLGEEDTLGRALINMRDNLSESERRLMDANSEIQTIFNAIQDTVIIIDEEGIITKWDHKSEMLFGWKEEEVIGTLLSDAIIPSRFREAHQRGMKHFLQSAPGPILNRTIEVKALKKNNEEFDISLSISTSRINDKYRFIGFIRDITSRKKAEAELRKSEERYRQIVETAQEGIWVIDENNNTTFVNKKMCEIIEYLPEEIIGKKIHSFMDEEANENAAAQIERRKQGLNETHDSTFITKTGKVVWTTVSTNPIFGDDGKYIGALAMVIDITHRKLDEILLQKSEANLEIKNKELELKNKELEQFAYVASHDLQEPLRTTSSFVELLQDQYKGKLDARADKYLAYIVQSSDRMKALIKDLLDYSRIGGKKEKEEVDSNITMKDVIDDVDLAINETHAQINFCRLPVITGYPTELKQLFQNLVINAIKFRKKDTVPVLNISAEKKEGHWQFAFRDNGIGIEEQYRERVFIIFQRLHTRNDYEGSGIGLAHCKKIVGLHGGKIWIESVAGEGTTFHFTIPKNMN